MAQKHTNSAVSRLLAVLRTGANLPGQMTTSAAVCSMFGEHPDDSRAAYRRMADLHGLIAASHEEVRAHTDLDQELYSEALNGVEQLFASVYLQSPWEPVRAQLNGAPLTSLRFVAEQIDRRSDEIEVQQDELDAVLGQLQSLCAIILQGSIADDLKVVLVDRIEAARRAIIDYKVTGLRGVRIATESAVGALVLAGGAQPSKATWAIEYVRVFGAVLDMINKASPSLQKIGSGLKGILGHGGE